MTQDENKTQNDSVQAQGQPVKAENADDSANAETAGQTSVPQAEEISAPVKPIEKPIPPETAKQGENTTSVIEPKQEQTENETHLEVELPSEVKSEEISGRQSETPKIPPKQEVAETPAKPTQSAGLEVEPPNEKPKAEIPKQPEIKSQKAEAKTVEKIAPNRPSKTGVAGQSRETPPRNAVIAPGGAANFIQNLLIRARARIQEKKKVKLDKIMEFLDAKRQITNKDIQKLLRTNARTALRYLDQLEQEQKIIQVGKTGRGVLYIKKP